MELFLCRHGFETESPVNALLTPFVPQEERGGGIAGPLIPPQAFPRAQLTDSGERRLGGAVVSVHRPKATYAVNPNRPKKYAKRIKDKIVLKRQREDPDFSDDFIDEEYSSEGEYDIVEHPVEKRRKIKPKKEQPLVKKVRKEYTRRNISSRPKKVKFAFYFFSIPTK